jgi:hypothetical protein
MARSILAVLPKKRAASTTEASQGISACVGVPKSVNVMRNIPIPERNRFIYFPFKDQSEPFGSMSNYAKNSYKVKRHA